jgi:hypothetical protein
MSLIFPFHSPACPPGAVACASEDFLCVFVCVHFSNVFVVVTRATHTISAHCVLHILDSYHLHISSVTSCSILTDYPRERIHAVHRAGQPVAAGSSLLFLTLSTFRSSRGACCRICMTPMSTNLFVCRPVVVRCAFVLTARSTRLGCSQCHASNVHERTLPSHMSSSRPCPHALG